MTSLPSRRNNNSSDNHNRGGPQSVYSNRNPRSMLNDPYNKNLPVSITERNLRNSQYNNDLKEKPRVYTDEEGGRKIHEHFFTVCPHCFQQNEYDSAKGLNKLNCFNCRKTFMMSSAAAQKFVYEVEYMIDRCGIELLPFSDPHAPGTRVG
eukprot:UN26406